MLIANNIIPPLSKNLHPAAYIGAGKINYLENYAV
jgi:hypothetical protein